MTISFRRIPVCDTYDEGKSRETNLLALPLVVILT
jgi:hypothetical protein